MTEDEKQIEAHRLLKSAGFLAPFLEEDWFNHEQRKFFTRKVVRDMSLDWLRKRLKEPVSPGEYWFYCYHNHETGAWENMLARFDLLDLRAVPKPVET